MPIALKNKIDLISSEFFDMLNDYVDYLVFKSQEKSKQSAMGYSEEFWSLFGAGKDLDLQIPSDMLIAATALAENATIITHNVDEFSRIKNLNVEDWTK